MKVGLILKIHKEKSCPNLPGFIFFRAVFGQDHFRADSGKIIFGQIRAKSFSGRFGQDQFRADSGKIIFGQIRARSFLGRFGQDHFLADSGKIDFGQIWAIPILAEQNRSFLFQKHNIK
jgi:hypothetical protein